MTVFTRFRTVVGAVAIGALFAGCAADEPAAPTAVRGATDLTAAAARGGNGNGKRGNTKDTAVVHFTIDPTVTATYDFGGNHRLWVRAGGVCDLDAPYGPEYWDTPCKPTTKAVQVTAHSWTDSLGHPRVDFQPKLRFAPLPGGLASAVIYFHDHSAASDPSALILYCMGGKCVNEETTDPFLLTLQDQYNNFVFRQIKHFSGYEVAVGRNGTSDPSLY